MSVRKLIQRVIHINTVFFIGLLICLVGVGFFISLHLNTTPETRLYYDKNVRIKYFFRVTLISMTIFYLSMAFFLALKIRKDWVDKSKKWLSNDKESFFVCAFIVAGLLLLIIDFFTENLASEDFWYNVLVEAHGMFMDIVLFGIIFTLYEGFYEKSNEIRRLQDEITYIKDWKGEEPMYRIVGNVRQLVKAGVKEINLREYYLKDANLSNLDLREVNLTDSTLNHSNLNDSKLDGSNLTSTDFCNASLERVTFLFVKLSKTNFSNADLTNASFKYCDLDSVIINENTLLNGLKFTSDSYCYNNVFKSNVINIFGEKASFNQIDRKTLEIKLI